MPAPKKNTYYLLAVGFKKPKRYKPAGLWKKAVEYFQWNDNNPLTEEKVFANGRRMKVNKMRAMTITGFCNFASIHRDTFNVYEKDKAYSDITARIKDIIYQQKLEGAAADLLNPMIIAREVGLKDQSSIDHTTKGEKIGDIDLTKYTDEELRIIAELQRKGGAGQAASS